MAIRINAVYEGLKSQCQVFLAAAQQKLAEEAERKAAEKAPRLRLEAEAELAARRREAEAEAARQQAAASKRMADFRDAILSALRASEEPDPFASIRGDFDLSASDSHQWKSSFKLPDADKCGLIKTPQPTSTSGIAWTFACIFRSTGDGYEGMVKRVQSVINLPYQPDERAANINQVFFSDPSKPAWRLFVAKINEATVGISVVALRSPGALPTVPNTAPFPAVPTMLPTEPTVRNEVEKIHAEPHQSIPTAQRANVSVPAASGRTTMTVKNSTAYELSLFFEGPVSKKLTLAPGESQDLDLVPGTFQVAGRVAATDVLPFYGEETYASSARYSVTFYIAP